jgi:hypothetical protein
MATRGKSARAKGHGYELQVRDFFRELGYTECVSSRSESKNLDDKGVDLCFTGPYYVQCKAVEALGSMHKVLAEMPKEDKLNLVFHKRSRQGTIVAMDLKTFQALAKVFHNC